MRRNHTMEERLKAVLVLPGRRRSGEDVAQAHQIEVQTLRSWVKKIPEMGAAGLGDRRGQRLASSCPDKEEALRIENARLKRRMSCEDGAVSAKKVKELERGDR